MGCAIFAIICDAERKQMCRSGEAQGCPKNFRRKIDYDAEITPFEPVSSLL